MVIVTSAFLQKAKRAVYGQLRRVVLFTEGNEELTGHGYAAQPLEVDQWNVENGEYPELVWTFEAGKRVNVLAYAVLDRDDTVAMFEEFREPLPIQHEGDSIAVALRYELANLNATG